MTQDDFGGAVSGGTPVEALATDDEDDFGPAYWWESFIEKAMACSCWDLLLTYLKVARKDGLDFEPLYARCREW